jgi:FAD/FMN-containing dehydrogenase
MLLPAAPPLADIMKGRVVTPGDDGYDQARSSFNLTVDQRPAAVAYPVDAADVVAAIGYARANGLRVAPQATGHNAAPLGSLEDALVVHVGELTEVEIDAEARRVRVGAGAKWERVTPQLSALGLAALHGSSPDVGIAGYSLGGGMGWLARKHGLQSNSVTAMELVTADGRLVRVDADHEPGLFWALRGGGGNFGVVTAIEFEVFPYAELYAGQLFFPFERAGEVLHTWRRMLPELPDELMTWVAILHVPDLPDFPPEMRGRSFVVVFGVHIGGAAEGEVLLAPMRALAPEIDTFAMVPPAALGDLAMDPPDPMPYALTHHLLGDFTTDAVEDLLALVGPGSGSALAMVQLRHMGGALGRVAPGSGARATLPGEIAMLGLGLVFDEASGRAVAESCRALYDGMLAHRAGDYPNFVEEPANAAGFFDTETWDRLRWVKALYDPEDLFRGNHHIPPAEV